MEFCDTYVRDRHIGHDLWCRTHNMWVYKSHNSELLNPDHEKLRFDGDSPLLP